MKLNKMKPVVTLYSGQILLINILAALAVVMELLIQAMLMMFGIFIVLLMKQKTICQKMKQKLKKILSLKILKKMVKRVMSLINNQTRINKK